jgi:hypothetical protein
MGGPTRMTAAYRTAVAEAIVGALRARDDVAGCWEGGSAATGRLDDYSDIDLFIVAGLDRASAIFETVERALESVDRIVHRWHVEPPPFRDTAQRFYFQATAPRFFAVDCVITTAAGAAQFLERERHGEPRMYFDRTGTIRALPLDRAALESRRAQRLAQLQGSVPVYRMLVEKELARGHALEAAGFYQALLRALIELLGMRERPDRFDFAWRYIDTQLSEASRELLQRYAFVADATALEIQSSELSEELDRQLEAVRASLPAGRPSP